MDYTVQATQNAPALIIYLLDISASMNLKMGNKRRIDVVLESLMAAFSKMVHRSTKGTRLTPRYRIALLAYSDQVFDLLGGIKGIDQVVKLLPFPEMVTQQRTNTAKAFLHAERILAKEIPFMQNHPAPVICHMTDGTYTGDDPEPIVQRIMQMAVPDGNVLVENIFINDDFLVEPITNAQKWPGILPDTPLLVEHAHKLRSMSSIIPESYRKMMEESNYRLEKGACMMLPGNSAELVSLGFQMSAATPVR